MSISWYYHEKSDWQFAELQARNLLIHLVSGKRICFSIDVFNAVRLLALYTILLLKWSTAGIAYKSGLLL
jgi:hypothetical protein